MAVLTKEEYLAKVQALVGSDATDETIKNLEDLTDTYNQLETATASSVDWEKKYKENDASWKQKYITRFNEPSKDEGKKDETKEELKEKSIDDLFQ